MFWQQHYKCRDSVCVFLFLANKINILLIKKRNRYTCRLVTFVAEQYCDNTDNKSKVSPETVNLKSTRILQAQKAVDVLGNELIFLI